METNLSTDSFPIQSVEPLDLKNLLTKVTRQVEQWDNDTSSSNDLCKRDRDYIDHKQWTDEQAAKLKAREQAPIVVNRIKPKHEGLKGLVSIRKTDPKAFPRNPNPNDEGAAHAATDALRFIADQNDFNDSVKLPVADNFFGEGTAAAIIDIDGEDIRIRQIPWDRFYYDPKSRKKDFSDARYLGFFQWLDKDQVEELLPGTDFEYLLGTNDIVANLDSDKMGWCNRESKRALIAMHYFIYKGEWWMCIFNKGAFLMDPEPSPYIDAKTKKPMCPIEAVTAYIDRDGNRYGEVRGFIDQQDEINHRRSKALYLLSARQTYSNGMAGIDVAEIKRELRKPNGHISIKGAAVFGQDFGVIPTSDMTEGQLGLYQDAKAELDSVSFNAQLAGERQNGDLSGKAIDRLQQAGTIELNGLFTLLNGWEKRCYIKMWSMAKQFWNEEKWIRVTDDQKNLRWVGLNHKVTVQEFLEEQVNDKALDPEIRKRYAASYQFLMSAAQQGIPDAVQQLAQIIEVRNNTNDLDVDIIIDQSYDVVNIQQEQFQTLAPLWQGTGLPITELIRLSNLPGKDEVIEKIEKAQQQQAEANQGAAQIQQQSAQVKNAKTASEAAMNQQKAIQTGIENELLINQPQQVTSVAV